MNRPRVDLARFSVTVVCVADGGPADLAEPDVVVLDLDARWVDSLDVYRWLREQLTAPVIVVSCRRDLLVAVDPETELALAKPFSIVSLLELVRRSLGVELELPAMFRRGHG